uniref:Uncharacterized protein n=1 Tax=Glossina palpalis gambiensis TaxID=67801 RepID=A0A1B0BHH0_9MUSC
MVSVDAVIDRYHESAKAFLVESYTMLSNVFCFIYMGRCGIWLVFSETKDKRNEQLSTKPHNF